MDSQKKLQIIQMIKDHAQAVKTGDMETANKLQQALKGHAQDIMGAKSHIPNDNDMIAKALSSPLDERISNIPNIDKGSELKKIGLIPNEAAPSTVKHIPDIIEDAGGMRKHIPMEHPVAETLSDVLNKVKNRGGMVANESSKLVKAEAPEAIRKMMAAAGKVGKKGLKMLPVVGGLASALINRDASAALGSIPVAGELFDAEKLGEDSDKTSDMEPAFPTYTSDEERRKRHLNEINEQVDRNERTDRVGKFLGIPNRTPYSQSDYNDKANSATLRDTNYYDNNPIEEKDYKLQSQQDKDQYPQSIPADSKFKKLRGMLK